MERHIAVEKTKAESEPEEGWTFAAVLEAFKHQVELDRVRVNSCAPFPGRVAEFNADFGRHLVRAVPPLQGKFQS